MRGPRSPAIPRSPIIARDLGLRPFELADGDRTRYHTAAVVASNHLVALLGQVDRLATSCDVPFEAFAPLVLASVQNAFQLGPAEALTGPVARGDLSTVERHLQDLDPAERDAYRALAREAARLTGRRDTGLDRLLDDLRQPRTGDPARPYVRGPALVARPPTATISAVIDPPVRTLEAGTERGRRMLHLTTIAEFRAACDRARSDGRRVGLVPTMGFLHEGHCSLMRAARAETDFVVVTIFVNPLQFGAGEDLDQYPRDLTGDLAQCEREGVDVVFAPTAAEMYPNGAPLTTVHVERLTADLCGAARPTHFDGVTTVVAKLFAIAGPVPRVLRPQGRAATRGRSPGWPPTSTCPVDVVGCPIVREPDGLALSSRNAYLSPDERRAALVLSRALEAAARRRDRRRTRHRDARQRSSPARSRPNRPSRSNTSRHATRTTSRPLPYSTATCSLHSRPASVPTRLIDNVTLSVHATGVAVDLGSKPCSAR